MSARIKHPFSLAIATAMLAACGNNGSPADSLRIASSDEILVTRAQCTPFGNPPRPRNDLLTDLESENTLCPVGGTRLPDWPDPNGTTRRACLFDPGTATAQRPLPLLVFLQASGFPSDPQLPLTNLLDGLNTADLSGDPARPGFILLEPIGRVTDHFYPPPNDTNTVGWDVWYRQFQPFEPARTVNGESFPLNADAAALDHYIAEQVATGKVDTKRIYIMGWSNGAALALLYGQNRPNVAAVAMYSGPDPYDSLSDTCGQKPITGTPRDDTQLQVFNHRIPVFHIQNNCDIYATCPNGLALRDTLMATGTAAIRHQIIDGQPQQQATEMCVDSCGTDPRGSADSSNPEARTLGVQNHFSWPKGWTDDYFAFMRDHPRQ